MNEIESYVTEVLRNVHLSRRERARIEADLRAHLAEATAAGEPPAIALARMGSPAQVAEAFMSGAKLTYAPIWRRFVAFAIDVALLAAVAAPLVFLGTLLGNLTPQAREGSPWAGAALLVLALSLGVTAVAIALLYFPIAEGRFGRTLGKRWLGLRVLKENGLAIGYKEAFLRRIPLFFRFALLDALFVPFTAKRQRAFDIVARTVVVSEE